MPGTITASKENAGHVHGALHDLLINYNALVKDVDALRLSLSSDVVNIPCTMSRGSTDDQLATSAFSFSIAGVPVIKAAVANTPLGSLGTIAINQWSMFGVDIVAAGTITFVACVGYAAGFATEALALAATCARIAGKARVGYVTIKTAVGTTFVTDTDALAGGSTGNVASQTNYYSLGLMRATGADANGVQIATTLSIGSSDVTLGITAFTFNANGIPLAKAAVVSQAYGALGVVPADKWALVAANVDLAGTVTFSSATNNYTTGYATEALAIADMPAVVALKARFGYVTIKTKAALTFTFATDSPFGGASGNVASATNYYPAAGIVLQAGLLGAQVGNLSNPPVAYTS